MAQLNTCQSWVSALIARLLLQGKFVVTRDFHVVVVVVIVV